MFLDNHFQRKSLILNMINHLGPVSRTALIEYTAYRPATVGALVTELLDENLIVETGYLSNGQGRKRALLEINKEHICAVGIYFSLWGRRLYSVIFLDRVAGEDLRTAAALRRLPYCSMYWWITMIS